MSALASRQVEAPFNVVVGNADGDLCEIAVVGELDLDTAPHKFRAASADMIAALPGRVVVVDCTEMSFIDSTGLGVLVGALERARNVGGDVRLRSLRRGPRKALEITRLAEAFAID